MLAGAREEFIFVGRLDNLAMSYCSLRALIDAFPDEASLKDEAAVKAVALFDHEEVGSSSAQGKLTTPLKALHPPASFTFRHNLFKWKEYWVCEQLQSWAQMVEEKQSIQ